MVAYVSYIGGYPPPPPNPTSLSTHPHLLACSPYTMYTIRPHIRVPAPQCAYLKDGYGDYIWPEDWMIKCVCNPPATYYVVEKEKEAESIDPSEDLRYAGESLVIITDVPEDVYHKDLRAWIRCGLADEDRWGRGGAYMLYAWNLSVHVVHAGAGVRAHVCVCGLNVRVRLRCV